MTLNAKRRKVHDKLAAMPGVQSVRRPVISGGDAEFDLYYVRTGEPSQHPLVIIPGGPGMASVQLYKGLRRRAAGHGLDVIMVEHRGIGMSRHDDNGAAEWCAGGSSRVSRRVERTGIEPVTPSLQSWCSPS